MKFINLRLLPGDDVRLKLLELCRHHSLRAASVVSAVGSLQQASIRYASGKAGQILQGPFEIVSFSGTLSVHGLHIHMALADGLGEMVGGHLMEGCLVHTTLELVLLEQSDNEFFREPDSRTGYSELVIKSR